MIVSSHLLSPLDACECRSFRQPLVRLVKSSSGVFVKSYIRTNRVRIYDTCYDVAMPQELIWPSIVMSLAFVFYTAGVWGERLVRDLKGWHIVSFWLGLAFDTYGTWLMERMRAAGQNPDIIHSVTGVSAFGLMALHAVWASWVLARGLGG